VKLGNKLAVHFFRHQHSSFKDFKLLGTHHRAGTIGVTGAAMDNPLFGPPSKKNGDNFKPRYVCTSDSSIHVSIVTASATCMLALNAILITDTKKEDVVFWTRSTNTN